MNIERLLQPDLLALGIPLAAILVCGAVAITKMVIHHRERMAMIEQGIDPDRRGHEDEDLDDADSNDAEVGGRTGASGTAGERRA